MAFKARSLETFHLDGLLVSLRDICNLLQCVMNFLRAQCAAMKAIDR